MITKLMNKLTGLVAVLVMLPVVAAFATPAGTFVDNEQTAFTVSTTANVIRITPVTVTPSTSFGNGALAVTLSGTLVYLSGTTWIEVGQKATTASFVPAK